MGKAMRAKARATARAGSRKRPASKAGRRRTKGPSEKIRSLAALNVARKIGYLTLSDLAGGDPARLEEVIQDKLPSRNYRRNDNVYPTRTGEPMLFLVRSGAVNIFRKSQAGKQIAVKKVEPGHLFGEMPALGQSMHGCTAEAAETSSLVPISAKGLDTLLEASPEIASNALRVVGPRLVEAEKQQELSAFQPVTARVAALLLSLADKNNEVSGYTHQDIADRLGVYRETVTNAIAELKNDRLLKVGRKKLTLTNVEGLRRLSAF